MLEDLKKVRTLSDSIVLFNSLSGKDSIMLSDLCCSIFDKVISVFMYTIKDLEQIESYKKWHLRYKNHSIIEVPHFALSSQLNIRPRMTLNKIDETIKYKTGINWSCYGFKQNDSMNRRLMLKTYENQIINYTTKKIYPLSKLSNKDVLTYIEQNNLIQPIKYGNGKSQGINPNDIDFLIYTKEKYPNDFQKILKVFPQSERIVFEYEYKQNRNN